MIILNKKRTVFLFSFIVFSIFCYSLNNSFSRSIFTSSTPATMHTIILDAGHGYPDGGATGNGSIESDLNLNIVLKLQNILESSGCTVLLTRSDGNGIYDSSANTIRKQKISDMKNREKIANNSNADIFVSIHMNKLPEAQYSGWQTFYKRNDNTSSKLAKCIQENLNNFLGNNNREIKPISNIYLAEHVEIPLVIVECGFLSNEKENSLLKTDSYQDKLAWAIYTGIMDYFAE